MLKRDLKKKLGDIKSFTPINLKEILTHFEMQIVKRRRNMKTMMLNQLNKRELILLLLLLHLQVI